VRLHGRGAAGQVDFPVADTSRMCEAFEVPSIPKRRWIYRKRHGRLVEVAVLVTNSPMRACAHALIETYVQSY